MPADDVAAAATARAEFRAILEEKGHAVDVAQRAVARLELAFADGSLRRSKTLDRMLGDLASALQGTEDQRLGGKSAEAARFILRAISRAIDDA